MSVELNISTQEMVVETFSQDISTGLPVPLFVVGENGEAPLDILQSRVRLSGLKDTTDAYAMFINAVTEVRANFYRRLGESRINQVLETDYSPSPANADMTIRALAFNTEVEWVRLLLLQRLKIFFADNSAQAREIWNEDGLTRAETSDDVIDHIQETIRRNLDLISGDVPFGEESQVSVSLLEPAIKPLPAGASVWTDAQKNSWRRRHG